MSVRRVNSGEPITAFWANSIVNALDTYGGNRNNGTSGVGGNAPQQFTYPAAFQIQMTASGCWTIEAGTIYINGKLIQGNGNTYGQHSSSLQNWEQVYFHNGKNLPKWKIKGYIPSSPDKDISLSKFWLINENADNAQELKIEPPLGYSMWELLINDVDEKQGTIKQLVSGTIHITMPVAGSNMRPFDIRITGTKTKEEVTPEGEGGEPAPDPAPQAEGEEPTPEGGEPTTPEGETPEEDIEEDIVEFEVMSGTLLLPNKERVLIPQKLGLSHSTAEPFLVILNVKRDSQGVIKFNYEMLTEEALALDGWTLTEAVEGGEGGEGGAV